MRTITLTSIPAEAWAAITALLTGVALIAKKLLTRRPKPAPDPVTRAEFHHGMEAVRDRIGAGYLALADKLEQQHNHVLTKLDHQGANFERRLDSLDSAVARLDERTKCPSQNEATTL